MITVGDVLSHNSDILIKYRGKINEKISAIVIPLKYLKNSEIVIDSEVELEDILRYYIDREEAEIIEVFTYSPKKYSLETFEIKILRTDRDLSLVSIFNKETGVSLNDWVRSDVLSDGEVISNLIRWDERGDKLIWKKEDVSDVTLVEREDRRTEDEIIRDNTVEELVSLIEEMEGVKELWDRLLS